jgi:dTDP-4-dehydrorhamnose reductase
VKTGLIGYTGFVGGYLSEIFPDASLYNSSNISEIVGENFDLLLISAMPAEKWKANKFPDEDKSNLENLKTALSATKASRVLLISTVDVFETPLRVSESDVPVCSASQAYGVNRRDFEKFIQGNFPKTWIVRLPGLVGTGLKKNVIFDIKQGKPTTGVPLNSVFQFYPMSRIGQDLQIVLKSTPGYFHFAVEPLSIFEICHEFGLDEKSFAPISTTAPLYDFRTERVNEWEKSGHYLLNKNECLQAIGRYLNDI